MPVGFYGYALQAEREFRERNQQVEAARERERTRSRQAASNAPDLTRERSDQTTRSASTARCSVM